MIVSAVSLWKKLDMSNPLAESEWGAWTEGNAVFTNVSYSGHKTEDGSVRVYAVFGKPAQGDSFPVILLLPDGGKSYDIELMQYFISRGYAVLMPDYSGKMSFDDENTQRTVYPKSLEFANFETAQGLDDLDGLEVEQSCWFEWLYVATYSIEYLKNREDVTSIGVVGIRMGGEIAWKAMLSPDLKCGVPVNAVGWRSYKGVNKFSDNAERNMRDSKHCYIAGVDSQSYASFVKCPVLMLCALRDDSYDPDRAYDTYCRIGVTEGSAIAYSLNGGSCIGSKTLGDLDLFLGKHLKGREIYIPSALNISVKENGDKLDVFVDGDPEAILSELGVYYAEAELNTKSVFRDWHRVGFVDGKEVKDGKYVFTITPESTRAGAFVYVSAKYFNDFRIASKIIAKKITSEESITKNKLLYEGKNLDTFCVAENKEYSIGDIFFEKEALPKKEKGYGGIEGAYSVGGIKTYKISSPTYLPEENSLLKFDAYSETGVELLVTVDVAETGKVEKFRCRVPVKAGGKWKRIILKADDFKNEIEGGNLETFLQGKALAFESEKEEDKFAVTNIVWL